MLRWCPAALLVLLVASVAACRATEAARSASRTCTLVRSGYGPPGRASVKAEIVAEGLEVPWGIAFLPGGDLLVTERAGRIRRLSPRGAPIATVATLRVEARGEGGLLGIALHPEFEKNRLFYVYLTAPGGDSNRVERHRLAEDGRRASLDRVILSGIPAARFHDGGRIRFGPDGMLYVSTGDAREPESSRDLASLAGKLLRVDAEGNIPPDDPWPRSPAFLVGLRNPQGFDWLDRSRLVIVDHGPSGELGRTGHDEVNIARRGDDLGWPTIFGCGAQTGLASPALSWVDAVPPGGAAIYTGTAIPEWRGAVLVGTLASKHLHLVKLDRTGRVERHEVYFDGDPPRGFGRLRDVVMGPDAELYVTTSNCDGRGECPPERDRILRITR